MTEDRGALTDREQAVVRHIMAGKTGREIASALDLAFETVKAHTRNIRKKLGVRNKVEIAMWGSRNLGG